MCFTLAGRKTGEKTGELSHNRHARRRNMRVSRENEFMDRAYRFYSSMHRMLHGRT
jgi:hypothetical protein